ncbi:MAG: site-specific integrase, partial [Mesorhizobium sp.]
QTLSMTMRYAHLATNDLDGCVVVLEKPRAEEAPWPAENSVFASPLTTPSSAKAARKESGSEPAKAGRKSSKGK